MSRFYIFGTPDQPTGLFRWNRDEPAEPFSYFDGRTDDFLPSWSVGTFIFDGTEVNEVDVPDVRQKLVTRYLKTSTYIPPTPAAPSSGNLDDPFANGLSLVRYENVNGGRRPPGSPPAKTLDVPAPDRTALDAARAAAIARWTPRADGKVYCCAGLGWVTPDVAFDHGWATSRPPEEYERDFADEWLDVQPGK